jgi:hypothetical protein
MAVYVPFGDHCIGIAVAGEPDPDAVCQGHCGDCLTLGYCPRELRRLEEWADAMMLGEILYQTRH